MDGYYCVTLFLGLEIWVWLGLLGSRRGSQRDRGQDTRFDSMLDKMGSKWLC